MNFSTWLKKLWFTNKYLEDSRLFANEPPISWKLKPHPDLSSLASNYMNSTGMNPKDLDIEYNPLIDDVGKQVASEYDKLQHTPNDPSTKNAYAAFKKDILAQFKHLLQAGYKFTPTNYSVGDDEHMGGYPGAREMRDDVTKNKHIDVFVGGDLPADHPLAEPSPYTIDGHQFNYNELFRAVHDIFGHAHHGNHFGPRGEEHAYRLHSRMFSPQARPAMAAETRGQNSWLHYGPNQNIPLETRPYAQQKAAIMPNHLLGDIHKPVQQNFKLAS